MTETADIAAQRARLAGLEDELARLQREYELAMSAFKFDAVKALQDRIAALDSERSKLAEELPATTSVAEPETGIIPTLVRPLRRRRRLG